MLVLQFVKRIFTFAIELESFLGFKGLIREKLPTHSISNFHFIKG